MSRLNYNSIYYVLIIFLLFSCKKDKLDIKLLDKNFNTKEAFVLDYSNAFENGFVIPSKNVNGISTINLSFEVKNFDEDTLCYKLYYQNESYKFDNYDPLNSENFYGCSLSTLEGFKKVGISKNKTFIINDSIVIKGNPRNEEIHKGNNTHSYSIDTISFNNAKNKIKADSSWYYKVVKKAESSSITVEKQLELDALWVVNNDNSGSNNNRWQRNPRVGDYSIFLVITNKKGVAQTPGYISNTTYRSREGYVNPYAFFNSNNNKLYNSLLINHFLTIKAEVPLKNGIYLPYSEYTDKSYYNKYVNDDKNMYYHAVFNIQETSQFQKEIANIPLKAKFLTGNYSKKDYYNNIKKYDGKRIKTRFMNTTSPGKTFGIDSSNNSLWFKNPYYKNAYVKENVGVKTRHGFTYGKYTFKVKMANLLTKDNVWTGLTNALWLVKESDKKWNSRRTCTGEGFMPYYGAKEGEKRVPQVSYSEIDFEILKTAETWPSTSYIDKLERKDPPENDDKIMVTCTNWDLACMQPKNFGVGVQKIEYQEKEFYPHRWNDYYQALTIKSAQNDKELFSGDYYYFQIEWKPKEIIWRIGPSKDNLRIVGYMNDEITTIPNNQMVTVLTQEYHFAEWWPKAPYKQENIPFPGEDLKGRLYSLEIE